MDKQEIYETTLVRLRRSSQITLPLDIREAAKIHDGDYLEASVTEDGILLRPVTVRARHPSRSDEALIQSVVNEVRRDYAQERRH
jgi:AbrB family looped-hinge helix DNA binding protein